MMNKRYIYRCLLLPLITCIMVGIAGCGNDVTEEEGRKASADGGTYLTVTARGITDQPSADGSYDDYIASLRVLAFDEKGNMLCNALYKSAAGQGVKEWTVVGENAVSIKEKLGNGGGRYSFYFIANEEGHSTTDNAQSLTNKLEGITARNELDDIEISFSSREMDGKNAIIMTAVEEDRMIFAGMDNSGIDVELERVLAKVRIQVTNQSSQSPFSVFNVKLAGGQIPASYVLLKGGTGTTKQFLSEETDMSGGLNGDIYTSRTIYMPERILDQPDEETEALKIALNVTVANQSKHYELPVGNGNNKNYNIERNTDYTTTGTIKEWGNPIIINTTVQPWAVQEEEREWLGSAQVEFNANQALNKKNNANQLYVVYDENKPTDVTFTIKVTAPVGNEWTVVCSNPAQFEATIENGTNGGVIKENDVEHTISIKAKEPYPVDAELKPQTEFYVTFSNGDYVTDMVIRSLSGDTFTDGYAGGSQTRFVIVQEQAAIN